LNSSAGHGGGAVVQGGMQHKPQHVPLPTVAPFPIERFLGFIKQLKVITKDYGLIPFGLLGTQQYVLDEITEGLARGVTTFIILKARQLGMSTVFIALDLFWAFEHAGLAGAFATHTEQSRDQFRNIIETFFNHLPTTHKVRYSKHNRSMLILKNGSTFGYLVAGVKEKTTANLGRSGAFNFLHATEVAFWGNELDLTELRATLSTHYAHRLQIYESTANGFNHWEDMCTVANDSKTQKFIFVGWWRNELYQFTREDPRFKVYCPSGSDEKMSLLERKRHSQVKERYATDVTIEQIAWYRWKLDEDAAGDQMKMDEMFPWLPEDAFVATGSKFFTSESLTDSMRRARKMALTAYRYVVGLEWADLAVVPAPLARAELKIWEEAHPHGHYCIGCDPAYGSSETADRTVIHVARAYADRLVQVAEFVSPTVSTYQCAWVLAHLAGYYSGAAGALVNLEISGPGTTVFQALNDLREQVMQSPPKGKEAIRNVLNAMRHFLYRRPDALAGELAYQWRMTFDNKLAMMTGFKDSFELQRHVINSMHLLEEMKSVVYESGQIQAEGRKKDDRVIAAALCHEAWVRWARSKLRGMGLTYLKAQTAELNPTPNQVQRMAINYLKEAKIVVNDDVITGTQ
jgi:hypothetical protein